MSLIDLAVKAAVISAGFVLAIGSASAMLVGKPVVDCRTFTNFSSCATHPDTSGKTLFIDKHYETTGITITGRGLRFSDKGRLTVTSGAVTHYGAFEAPIAGVIDGRGSFVFGRDGSVKEVYPQWFGLSAAAADNTESLQKAIDSLPGGGTVRFKGSGIHVTGKITPRSGVNLIGDSHQFVLKLGDNRNTDVIREEYTSFVDNIRISGFAIDGNKAANPSKYAGTAIHFGGRNIEVDNMFIHDTAAAGIILGVPSGGGRYTIRDNYVLNPSVADIGWGAIAVTGGEEAVISGNVAVSEDGYQAYGIDLEPNPGWAVKGVRITGNTIVRGRISVGVSDLDASTANITIDNNHVDALGAFGASYDSGSAMFAKNITGYLIIRDNQFSAPDQSSGGIRIERSEGFSVQDNTILVRKHAGKGSEIGLWVVDSRYGRVTGNGFRAASGHTPRFGVYEQGTSDYITYTGNTFTGIAVDYQLKGIHNVLNSPPSSR